MERLVCVQNYIFYPNWTSPGRRNLDISKYLRYFVMTSCDFSMKLIADSGSTKTDWILVSAENGILEIHCAGINPVRDSQDAIISILKNEFKPQIPPSFNVREIHFYGAGCILPFSKIVEESLLQVFPQAKISVDSDLLGAARALCGHQEGIACILSVISLSCKRMQIMPRSL